MEGLMPTVWKHKCKVYMLSDINQQPTVGNFLINGKNFQVITNIHVASEKKHSQSFTSTVLSVLLLATCLGLSEKTSPGN
jgi:hypothetical protein